MSLDVNIISCQPGGGPNSLERTGMGKCLDVGQKNQERKSCQTWIFVYICHMYTSSYDMQDACSPSPTPCQTQPVCSCSTSLSFPEHPAQTVINPAVICLCCTAEPFVLYCFESTETCLATLPSLHLKDLPKTGIQVAEDGRAR